jgi:hypothetical protein
VCELISQFLSTSSDSSAIIKSSVQTVYLNNSNRPDPICADKNTLTSMCELVCNVKIDCSMCTAHVSDFLLGFSLSSASYVALMTSYSVPASSSSSWCSVMYCGNAVFKTST